MDIKQKGKIVQMLILKKHRRKSQKKRTDRNQNSKGSLFLSIYNGIMEYIPLMSILFGLIVLNMSGIGVLIPSQYSSATTPWFRKLPAPAAIYHSLPGNRHPHTLLLQPASVRILLPLPGASVLPL